MSAPKVINARVAGLLKSSTQIGRGLILTGTAAEKDNALIVNAGAEIKRSFVAPVVLCIGDSTADTFTAAHYDPIYASSVTCSTPVSFCPLVVASQFSQDYYVSPDGNDDTANGTVTNPWKTIQRALSAAGAVPNVLPKVIHLQQGVYEGDLQIDSCVTITSDIHNALSSANVVINGNVFLHVYRGYDDITKNVVILNGLTINGRMVVQNVPTTLDVPYEFKVLFCTVNYTLPVILTGSTDDRQYVLHQYNENIVNTVFYGTILNVTVPNAYSFEIVLIKIEKGFFSFDNSSCLVQYTDDRTGGGNTVTVFYFIGSTVIQSVNSSNFSVHVIVTETDLNASSIAIITHDVDAGVQKNNLIMENSNFSITSNRTTPPAPEASGVFAFGFRSINIYFINNTFNILYRGYAINAIDGSIAYLSNNTIFPGSVGLTVGTMSILPTF